MTLDWTLGLYGVLVLVMLVGVAGALLPGIPGIGLIVLAIAVWGLVKGFDIVLVPLVVAGVLFLLGSAVDFLATYLGAKKAGASNWGQIGSVVGLLLGMFGFLPTLPIGGPIGPVIGILLGAVAGAIVGELLYRKNLLIALKAALGIVVGSLLGRLIQTLLAIICVAVFVWTTWTTPAPVPAPQPARPPLPEQAAPQSKMPFTLPSIDFPEWQKPTLKWPPLSLPEWRRQVSLAS